LYLVLATRFTVRNVEWVALTRRDAIRQIARKSMANDEATAFAKAAFVIF
jgi:urease accessory protein UreE